ncbi:Inner membrane protein YhcB [Candidatus Hartigia pinicola]|nr:Inner membrane protein YhcB [Candidatus Hartigia pinicola]
MTWEYTLIGLVIGFIAGVLVFRYGNLKLCQQKTEQSVLDKKNIELEEYRKELLEHFSRSAKLFDNMAYDYRQLHHHMVHSSSELMPNMLAQRSLFNDHLTESEADNDQAPIKIPQRYYSKDVSN